MLDHNVLLECADELVKANTGLELSQMQRLVLLEILAAGAKTRTYDQIATEAGYSRGYIKLLAAELWQLLSKATGSKVMKGNVQAILQQQLEREPLASQPLESRLTESQPQNESLTETAGFASKEASTIATRNPQPTITDGQDGEKPPTGNINILVVDDQPHNVALLIELMKHDDYEVWEADSGAAALLAAVEIAPDLILLDINMPDMDGYEVCQRLKADPQTTDIPIIFVSALDGSWDKAKGFTVGGDDYISKPFNTMEVIIRIENQLKIRQLQNQRSSPEEQAQAPLPTSPTNLTKRAQPSQKVTILMVDDEAKNLALLTNILEQEGYEVWQAGSGTEALRVAEMVLPNLILLDIKMPDMNGYDVCQQLKSNAKTKRIPVIFVSAVDKAWDKVKAFSAGGSDYVTKPIQIIELMARVRHQLQIWH